MRNELVKKKYKDKLFGNYIRNLRLKKQIGQRELARKIGVSASYLNDIEQNKRPSPRVEVLEALTDVLEADNPRKQRISFSTSFDKSIQSHRSRNHGV